MKKPLRLLLIQGTFCAIYEGRKQAAVFQDVPAISSDEAESIRTMDLSADVDTSPEQA